MNLLTQAIEYLYEYGNATLHHSKFTYNEEILFYIDNKGKIRIKSKMTFENSKETNEFDIGEEDYLQYLQYISLLPYYSINDYARQRDFSYLDYEKQDFPKKLSILAINEFYQTLLPMVTIKKDYIIDLVKNSLSHEIFIKTTTTPQNNEVMSIEEIMDSMSKKYNEFNYKLIDAILLWRNINDNSERDQVKNLDEDNDNNPDEEDNESIDENSQSKVQELYDEIQRYKKFFVPAEKINLWNAFTNSLYISEIQNKDSTPKTNLNDIKIIYKFLTDTKYSNHPAVARDDELKKLEISLLTNKSVTLVGPPGVGKTAIVKELAHRIRTGDVPDTLKNKRILEIETSSIISGCSLQGMLEQKVKQIMNYLKENPDTILFIDEIHTISHDNFNSQNSINLTNIIIPYLDGENKIKIIGATTTDEYENIYDDAFRRRFTTITISEPKNMEDILKNTIEKLEEEHKITWDFDPQVNNEIINYIIEYTKEEFRIYDNLRQNPDISIDIIERAFANAIYDNKQEILINHIAEAAQDTESLYESARKNLKNSLLSLENTKQSPTKTYKKIIKFQKK